MANQYADSFIHVIPNKFGKTAKELLREFANNRINYEKAAEITGFKQGTIRKWCNRYRTQLPPAKPLKIHHIKKINLKSKEVDATNVLYRKWQPVVAL